MGVRPTDSEHENISPDLGYPLSPNQPPGDTAADAARLRAAYLASRALTWVEPALSRPVPDVPLVHPTGINTQLHTTFFAHALRDGISLLELFGGLCAGLDMCLRNGVAIKRYIYVDHDTVVQRVARHRLHHLSMTYPHLLPFSAIEGAFQDSHGRVRHRGAHLYEAGAADENQWLVVAGWDCTDLSQAGNGAGIDGPKSNTFFPCVQILRAYRP